MSHIHTEETQSKVVDIVFVHTFVSIYIQQVGNVKNVNYKFEVSN